jgi:tetraacyldisaccharide-1-P 4'-kinase
VLLTTEKDMVRLEPIVRTIAGLTPPIVAIALRVTVDPPF